MEKELYGELGEIMVVSTTEVSGEGVEKHSSVIIELDGIVIPEEGDISIILSPHAAKELANSLYVYAEESNENNYNRLIKPSLE